MLYPVEIKHAEYNDLEEILNIQKKAFLSEAKIYNDYSFDALVQSFESIRADFNEYTFLKAVVNNEIVGSIKGKMVDTTCWIGRLIVKPEFQNQGIGKLLLTSIENEFSKAHGYQLFTGSKSLKNIKLYQSAGYTIIDQYPDKTKPDMILIEMKKENTNQ